MDKPPRAPIGALVRKITKSYLWGEQATKDTNRGALVLKITKSYLRDVRITKDIDGCLGPRNFKSYL